MTELTPQFLRVTNYEKYQHYKDRRPVWIKLYIDLLNDYQLNKQKPPTRLLAVMLLLLAATQDNKIPHDPAWLSEELHMSEVSITSGITALVTIGFLSVATRNHSASKRIAKRSKTASPEKRQSKRREEKEVPKAVTSNGVETASVIEIEEVRSIIDRSLREAS